MKFLICVESIIEHPGSTKCKLTASCNITTSQSHTTFSADKVQTTEIVPFAKWVLFSLWAINREKFGCNNIATILQCRILVEEVGKRLMEG